ncbi:MAG: SLBB domain-containing protein [Pyrinomonadaceae bacterium]|jgi:polysaccharide export outer membrane protein
MFRNAVLTTFIFFLVFSFTSLQAQNDDARGGYLIGPGDEITGKVLGEPQFDFVATVDEDGRIEVPFFDKPVDARCKTERELRSEISKLLARYLKNPQLSLRVTKRNSRPPVSIYGEVRQQQQVELTRRAYLLELISFAGGVTEKSGGVVQVFRPRPPLCSTPDGQNDWAVSKDAGLGVPSRMYSLASLRQGREEANPEILPGDIIVVPKASPVYVTGEVVRPGEISIPEGGLPLTQAIAMASGITREAKTKNVKIYRRKTGSAEPEVITVNLDEIKKGAVAEPMLMPFDIVEVDKAKKSIGDILLEAVTGIPSRIPIPIRPF